MLERLPAVVGRLLKGVRPGLAATLSHDPRLAALPHGIVVSSPAFTAGAPLDPRFTADGAGTSPPLAWSGVPASATAVVLLVEDADAPMPRPLVHLIAALPGGDGAIAAGAASTSPPTVDTGRNTFGRRGWLPPDPPPGHGEHRYVFQLFALDQPIDLAVGRGAITAAIRAHAVAVGSLVGTYRRD